MAAKRNKEPTWTSLVLEALRAKPNDFLSHAMLKQATGGSDAQIGAACRHLRKHRAADVVIETDGRGWWFALPPEQDDRSHHMLLRSIETAHRKMKHSKVAIK